MEHKRKPAELAAALNRQLERLIPVLTPSGVFLGFLFPQVFIALRPLVSWLFAVMTLSGALKLRARELGLAVRNPLPIVFFFLSSHVLLPLAVLFISGGVFAGDADIISGYILLYAAPTAVSGFIWVSIYRGDSALALAIILLDTLAAPVVVPGTVSILLGTKVALDMTGIAVSIIMMVVIPTIIGVVVNEVSRGKVPSLIVPYLNPVAKICIVLVIAANASAIAPQVHPEDPKVWAIAALCVGLSAIGYLLSKIVCVLGRLNPEKRVSIFFAVGLRNISAATTIAIEFFPEAAALPAILGIVFQQTMAAVMGKLLIHPAGTAEPPRKGPYCQRSHVGIHLLREAQAMKKFMDKDFLLSTKTAQRLYHEAAAAEPIFDYHCHLIPREIGEDRRFPDLAYIWLGEGHYGDHYKWRAMRSNGVDEKLITGNAEPYDRFLAWAETMPRLLGNPLYHWTHLELQRYFDIHEPLNRDSAPAIWKAANEKLKNDPAFSVYGIFKKFKVFAVGTTDDPADTLEWHEKIAGEGKTPTRVLPSFRPDRVINIDKDGFAEYIARLGAAAGKAINNLTDLLGVLGERINLFDLRGCRASDHGLEYVPFEIPRETGAGWEREVNETFTRVLAGEGVENRALESYKTFLLYFFGAQYHERGWVMQLHLSAIRNTNSRAFKTLGPDTGYDAIHDHPVAANLTRFLDLLEGQNKLPKTILYSLNVKDFYPLGTIMGGFQGGGIPGKLQLGSAWWFLDHKDGMEDQIKLLGNIGLLSRFVGMLTDSRSFLSYPRHEYFRRILCNILGTWVEDGEIPNDPVLLENMVKDISFRNAERYFG